MYKLKINREILKYVFGLISSPGLFLLAILLWSCSGPEEQEEVIIDDKSLEIKGADMSLLPEIRQSGIAFYNPNNQPEDPLQSLKNAGVNVVRLRIWKDPASPNSGFTSVVNLSREIKSLGLKTLLSVHYSDTWADPGKQTKPERWKNTNFEQLKDSVYRYTKKIMTDINPFTITFAFKHYPLSLPQGRGVFYEFANIRIVIITMSMMTEV